MKIKAVISFAFMALFFATTTFAQVAEPTTTSTGIPSKGQTKVPSTQVPTTPAGQKKRPQGKPNGEWSKEKGQKHAEGDHKEENDKAERPHRTEGDHKAQGEARKEGQGEKNGEHAKGDHKDHDGQVNEGRGENGKMKKAENTPEGTEQKSMKDRKTNKKSN